MNARDFLRSQVLRSPSQPGAPSRRAHSQAMEVLKKMDEVGIRPGVEAYNAVIAACAAAARPGTGGRAARALPYNDTALRAEFVDKVAASWDSNQRSTHARACRLPMSVSRARARDVCGRVGPAIAPLEGLREAAGGGRRRRRTPHCPGLFSPSSY